MEGRLFALALAAVVLAPLPLGANRPWAWETLAALFALLALGQALVRARAATPMPMGPLVLWTVALGWAAAQVFGVAPPVRPDLWRDAAAALGRPVPALVVLDLEAARAGLLRLVTYTAAFWLFAQWGASRRRAATALAVTGWAGAAWAAVALVLLAAGDRLPFAEKTAHLGFATGPFPNRNTLALWLAMAACALAAAGAQRRVWRRAAGWPWWLGAAVLGTALVATQSRAGLAAASVGLALTLARLYRPRLAVGVLAAVVVVAMVSPVGVRLAGLDPDTMPRLTVWATTLEGIAGAPWGGVGLGGFPDAFAEIRPRALLQPWHYAHNGYLELAWELGIPAALCLVAALGWIGLRLLRSGSSTAAAGAGALTAAALHGLVDFSPQIPAAALLLAVLLGSGCGRAGGRPAAPAPRPAPVVDPPPRPAAPERAPPSAPPP